MKLPSQATLRRLLDYDPETGRLTWKARTPADFCPGKKFAPERKHKRWNVRYAGTEAFASTDWQGYKAGAFKGRKVRAHRVIWKLMTGTEPECIDHQNGKRDDNRWANLRGTDLIGNARNSAKPSNNSSGHSGVTFNKKRGRWIAYIGNGGQIYLGGFARLEDAIAARKAAEARLNYHPNHGRSA